MKMKLQETVWKALTQVWFISGIQSKLVCPPVTSTEALGLVLLWAAHTLATPPAKASTGAGRWARGGAPSWQLLQPKGSADARSSCPACLGDSEAPGSNPSTDVGSSCPQHNHLITRPAASAFPFPAHLRAHSLGSAPRVEFSNKRHILCIFSVPGSVKTQAGQ